MVKKRKTFFYRVKLPTNTSGKAILAVIAVLVVVFAPIVPTSVGNRSVGYLVYCERTYACMTVPQMTNQSDRTGTFSVTSLNAGSLTTSSASWIGTVSIVASGCALPVNGQPADCPSQYQLSVNGGNSYVLLFQSSNLPSQDEYVQVFGSFTANAQGSCTLNGQPVACEPIGTIQVTSWQAA